MAQLTTDRRQPRPALSGRRTRNERPDPRRPAPVSPEMTKLPDGSDGVPFEQEHQRALAGPAALTTPLGLRHERRGGSRNYIDDYRYVVSAVEVSGRPPMCVRPSGATIPPGGISRKEG